jgi:ribosomal protein L37AE/L43A
MRDVAAFTRRRVEAATSRKRPAGVKRDSDFLREAVARGHRCPLCRLARLRLNRYGIAICDRCNAEWHTFRRLFKTLAHEMRWSDEAWSSWLQRHPTYRPQSERP